VKTDYFGWGVLYLLKQLSNFEAINRSIPDRISAVQSTLRQRKMALNARGGYKGGLLSPQRAEGDTTLFETVAAFCMRGFRQVRSPAPAKAGIDWHLRISIRWRLHFLTNCRMNSYTYGARDGPCGMLSMRYAQTSSSFRCSIRNHSGINSIDNQRPRRGGTSGRKATGKNIQHTDAVRHDVGCGKTYWSAAALMRRSGLRCSDQTGTSLRF